MTKKGHSEIFPWNKYNYLKNLPLKNRNFWKNLEFLPGSTTPLFETRLTPLNCRTMLSTKINVVQTTKDGSHHTFALFQTAQLDSFHLVQWHRGPVVRLDPARLDSAPSGR